MSDLSLILWVREYANPALTAFFATITSVGSVEFYMAAIPVIYWLVDKHFGFRFSLFFIFSAYVNSGVKHIFMTERPPLELRLVTQEGYSFPSGHAQESAAFWGFLALKLKTPLAYVSAGLIVLLISFSRIYLAVHWPIDIVGGLLIAVFLLALYARFGKFDLLKVSLGNWIIGSVVIALVLFLLHPAGDGPMTVGFLLGAMIGYRLELLYVNFQEKASWVQNGIKIILGLGVLFLLRIILKPLVAWLPASLSTVARYGLMGLWATLGAPYIFSLLGLFKRTTATAQPVRR